MHQPSRQLRRLGALFLSLIACAIVAPTASAADGDAYLDACFTGAATAGCTTDDFVDGTHTSALSSDGKRLYVGVIGNGGTGTRGSGILQFDVSPDGKLTRSACLTNNGNPSTSGDPGTRRCDFVPNLGSIQGMLVVGDNLYVTAIGGDAGTAILIFDNATTGVLTKKPDAAGCIRDGAAASGCDTGRNLGGIGPLAVNGAGTALYVRTGNGLAIFTRSPNGTLMQKSNGAGCWQETLTTGCTDGVGLATSGGLIRQMAVVGDQLFTPNAGYDFQIYACGDWFCVDYDYNGGVAVFDIAADGTLSQAAGTAGGCITNDGQSGAGDNVECVNGHDGLLYGRSVTGTGSDVYLGTGTGTFGGGLTLFHFRRTGGSLGDGTTVGTAAGCYGEGAGCTAANAVRGAAWLTLTPDGSELIVADEIDLGLGFMQRNTTTGALAQRPDPKDCVTRTGSGGVCETIAALSNPATVTVSPDSLQVFVTGYTHDSLVTLDRDMAPVCQSPSIDVPFNNSVVVPFGCSDANGDAITIEVTQQPTNGSLAGIDQGAGTVRYSPALGYTGADSFDFRAVTRGGAVTSGTNKVSLNVQPSPTPPVTDADGDGIQPPVDCDDSNPNIKPTTSEIPDNDVDENCDGIKATTPVARIRAGVDYFFDARNRRFTKVGRLNVTNIVAGATLRVTCKTRKKGCKFGTKKRKFSKATAKFNAKRYFNFTKKVRKKKRKIVSKLKAGARIEVRVTAPAMIGQVVTFKTRKGKTPSFTVKCLPVGATKPTKC